MKAFQLFLVPLIINLVNPANTIANWDWQNPLPQGNTLCCSFFINENTGWAAGELGVILKTVNGGDDWVIQRKAQDGYVRSIFFIDENSGWAAGNTMLRTVNGGTDWFVSNSGFNELCESVFFTDLSVGYCAGLNGSLFLTSDGGDNWETLVSGTSNHLLDISFVNLNTG